MIWEDSDVYKKITTYNSINLFVIYILTNINNWWIILFKYISNLTSNLSID